MPHIVRFLLSSLIVSKTLWKEKISRYLSAIGARLGTCCWTIMDSSAIEAFFDN